MAGMTDLDKTLSATAGQRITTSRWKGASSCLSAPFAALDRTRQIADNQIKRQSDRATERQRDRSIRRTHVAATLLVAALLVGGCGRAARDAPATGDAQGGPSALYRQALATAGKPLSAALAGMASARTFKALTERLVQASQAAGQAAEQLDQLTPPQEVRAEHADLIQAFQQLNGDLGGLSDAVDGHELCASSAVLARLGRAQGLAAVRDASTALAAAGGAQSYKLDVQVPPTPKEEQRRRLQSGQFVRPGSRTGSGELTIENHSGQDTVITLALGKRTVLSVYVRSGSKSRVTGVRDGVYQVYYTKGVDWDPKARAFTRDCAFERFDDTFDFKTTATQTTTWTAGLEPATGGNVNASEVSPSDYPAA